MNLTPKQKAERFLRASGNWPPSDRFVMSLDQFVRMLAWYAEVMKHGDGSGTFITNGKRAKTEPTHD